MTNIDPKVKHYLLVRLHALEAVVGQLSNLYEEHPELNDQVNIANIIPMSLDEWVLEIGAKADEILNMA